LWGARLHTWRDLGLRRHGDSLHLCHHAILDIIDMHSRIALFEEELALGKQYLLDAG
jgi:hypothetical protein